MARTRPDRRTTLITAGCITTVILAGALAVAANLGILDASTDAQVGTLSAAGDLLPTTAPASDAPATDRAAAGSTASGMAAPTSQTYAVDVAGTVTIAIDGDHLVVTGVVANPGWTWTQDPTLDGRVRVTFTDHTRSLLFDAAPAGGGAGLNATVGESTFRPTTTATGGAPAPRAGDHDLHEHEGGDDDD